MPPPLLLLLLLLLLLPFVSPARTVEMMMTSFSRPWKPSTVLENGEGRRGGGVHSRVKCCRENKEKQLRVQDVRREGDRMHRRETH